MDWLEKEGIDFLKKVGIKSYHTVLDFGSNEGNYTIPAAIITRGEGHVIAVDVEENYLEYIKSLAEKLKLSNIDYILNGEDNCLLNLKDSSIDFILLYDILHYFSHDFRIKLYKELLRLLKKDGVLSVFPKHNREDWPHSNFAHLSLTDIIKEIESEGFRFYQKICGLLNHFGMFERNCVYNFKKRLTNKLDKA